MEKRPYLIAGVKPSPRIKYENPLKQNQSDLKELHEYAHTRTEAKSNLLSFNERYERLFRPTSKVPQNNLNESC